MGNPTSCELCWEVLEDKLISWDALWEFSCQNWDSKKIWESDKLEKPLVDAFLFAFSSQWSVTIEKKTQTQSNYVAKPFSNLFFFKLCLHVFTWKTSNVFRIKGKIAMLYVNNKRLKNRKKNSVVAHFNYLLPVGIFSISFIFRIWFIALWLSVCKDNKLATVSSNCHISSTVADR